MTAGRERAGYVTIAGGRKDLAPEARKTEHWQIILPYIDGRYIRRPCPYLVEG